MKRLLNFDVNLMERLNDIRNGYQPKCGECLDLDYTLDPVDPRYPTLCIPCADKKMKSLQFKIKTMLKG